MYHIHNSQTNSASPVVQISIAVMRDASEGASSMCNMAVMGLSWHASCIRSCRSCILHQILQVIKPDQYAVFIQLAVETVFLEAASQLVAPGSSGLSGRQAEALERLAFDWALNAETYVEPKFGELTRSRERVCSLNSFVPACQVPASIPCRLAGRHLSVNECSETAASIAMQQPKAGLQSTVCFCCQWRRLCLILPEEKTDLHLATPSSLATDFLRAIQVAKGRAFASVL